MLFRSGCVRFSSPCSPCRKLLGTDGITSSTRDEPNKGGVIRKLQEFDGWMTGGATVRVQGGGSKGGGRGARNREATGRRGKEEEGREGVTEGRALAREGEKRVNKGKGQEGRVEERRVE